MLIAADNVNVRDFGEMVEVGRETMLGFPTSNCIRISQVTAYFELICGFVTMTFLTMVITRRLIRLSATHAQRMARNRQ